MTLRNLIDGVFDSPKRQSEVSAGAAKGPIAPCEAARSLSGLLETQCAADVVPEAIRWLWPRRFALGKLSMIVGDPDVSKSLLTIDLMARVTTGQLWPDDPNTRAPRGSAIIINCEDGVSDTIRTRLESAGAALQHVHIVTGLTHFDPQTNEPRPGWFTLDNTCSLEELIRRTPECRLVVIDPISGFMPGDVDSHRNTDVRGVLRPLSELAERTGVAVVIVSHLNKNGASGNAIYRTTGSLAFTAAARAVWAVTRDQDRPDGPRRLLLRIKNNLAPECGGLAYEITTDGGVLTAPRLRWESGVVTVRADDALTPKFRAESPDRDEAANWLRDALAAGPLSVRELKTEATDAGLTWGTIRRAKDELRVTVFRRGFGSEGNWVWSLPSA